MIPKRHLSIVTLLSKAPSPQTAKWLGEHLQVSERTIRQDIKNMQKMLAQLGAKIEAVRGLGYKLTVIDQSLFESKTVFSTAKNKFFHKANFADKKERAVYLVQRLLLANKPLKLDSLEEEMFVSKSTIQNDLQLVKKIFAKYQLTLQHRPYHGMKLDGAEFMKRVCLSNSFGHKENGFISGKLFITLFNSAWHEKIREIIISIVKEYNIGIADVELENLAMHILIACKRIEEKCFIEHEVSYPPEEYPFENQFALKIAEALKKEIGIEYPNFEISYIVTHLLGTKLVHKNSGYLGELAEAEQIISLMLHKLSTKLSWDFSNDKEFIEALRIHIRPTINRLKNKLAISNPLLQEIKLKFGLAFQGAVLACQSFSEKLNLDVPESEIAYIALHIAGALERAKLKSLVRKRVLLVCSTGLGSAKLLFYHLQNQFYDEIEIVDSISYYNLANYPLQLIDFIISTIPVAVSLKVPVVVINNFLDNKDIELVRQKLQGTSNYLAKYLDESKIFLQQEFVTRDDVLNFLCQNLQMQDEVSSDYAELVFAREKIAPTSFGNLVAIPHPLVPATKSTFLTICTLKAPIDWYEGKLVQFICLLNIKAGAIEDLETMYRHLVRIVENKSNVSKLLSASTVSEIMEILQTI